MTFARINSGKKGEGLAIPYLKNQGYKIIKRNYRTKMGEIDIIAENSGYICFMEVRSKSSSDFGSPEDTITRIKRGRIEKAALAYIKRFKLEDKPCRFDVVSVENINDPRPGIRLIKNAFELSERYRY